MSHALFHSVTRTKFIRVTALVGAGGCGLRAVLDSESADRRLPDSPEALLGTLVHRAIDARGREGSEAVTEHLLQALQGPSGVYRSDASASGEFRLVEIVGASRISSKLAAARRITEAIAIQPKRARRDERSTAARQLGHPRRSGDWSEEPMNSEELQLGGRLDLLRVTRDECLLVDFKTGRALDGDGSLKEAYADQLHLYALLARSCAYTLPIRMEIVAADGRFSVPESTVRTSRLGSELRALVDATPTGIEADARELARFSAGCATCHFRAWCGNYLESAPTSWATEIPRVEVPFDTWGNIESIRPTAAEGDFSSVVLRDAANRLVSVTGVPARHLKSLSPRMRAGFFGLRPKTTGRGHPQNFVLADPGNPSATAHAARVLAM